MSVRYWWSDDFQWFCIESDDGLSKSTVSLTREDAEALSIEADPKFADLLQEGRRRALALLEAAHTQARIAETYTDTRISPCSLTPDGEGSHG